MDPSSRGYTQISTHYFQTLDEICQAQAADDSLQPITQLLKDQAKVPYSSVRHYPKEHHMLLLQRDSLLPQDDVLYQKFHHSDGTTNFLQIVLPTKLHRSYVERLHADLGHFGCTKTCMAVSCPEYFQGWHSLPVSSFATVQYAICTNGVARHSSKPHLMPMQEFHPMAVLHVDLIQPLPQGQNSRNQRVFQYILSVVDSATRYL